MNLSFPLFCSLFLVIFCFFPFTANSQTTDSCNSTLDNLKGQLPFDVNNFTCHSVWDPQGFILRYAKTAAEEWSFLLSAPNSNGYIAMGFSPNGKMVGSSAIVGWIGSDGTAIMKKYFLGGQNPKDVQPNTGDLPVGDQSSITSDSGTNRIYMAFQLNTQQPLSMIIYSVGPTGFLPSAPNYRLTEHTNHVSTSLNYATGQTQKRKTYPIASLRRSHGVINMLSWGILMPIGAMAARYLRQWDPIWFYSHIFIQSVGFLLGVAGIICGFVLEGRLSVNITSHKSLGVVILVLGCLQIIALFARPDKGSKMRKYWNWYHHTIGRVLISLAAVNVFYGIHLGRAGSSWNAGYAISLVVLFIISLLLELRMWMKK